MILNNLAFDSILDKIHLIGLYSINLLNYYNLPYIIDDIDWLSYNIYEVICNFYLIIKFYR